MGRAVWPALVCLFCCQSVTLSAQHCKSLIGCTVCPVSTVILALSTLVCLSPLAVAISQIQVCHLASRLPSTFTLTISGLFQLVVELLAFTGPSGAGRALLPLRAPPPVESKDFRCRDFTLVPLVAVFLPFGRAISLFWNHRAGESCQSKPILGCPKLNPLFCGVWSSALFFGSKTMNGHPNQRFWGTLSWVGWDIRKRPLHSP